MLGRDVTLEQAREGVGDVMQGKRRRVRGRRRGGGGEERTGENRVKEKVQASILDTWARQEAKELNSGQD